MPQRLDPRTAHLVDSCVLVRLLPGVSPGDFPEVRSALAAFIAARRGASQMPTWQHAWNALTGAHVGRAGVLRYAPSRCGASRGRRYEVRHPARNLARTGHLAICGACRGTGRGQATQRAALYASPPLTEPDSATSAPFTFGAAPSTFGAASPVTSAL